jgi:hypothetical protein
MKLGRLREDNESCPAPCGKPRSRLGNLGICDRKRWSPPGVCGQRPLATTRRSKEKTGTWAQRARGLITRIDASGTATIGARAPDLDGRCQPGPPDRNRLAYRNNVVQQMPVRVR